MSKILEKRKLTIRILRQLSATKGTFTINDIKEELKLPRSTVQDWVSRFLEEGTINVVSEASGRKPALYKYTARPLNPCQKILTTVDEPHDLVEIYHFCESLGARYYCCTEYSKQGLVYASDPTGLFLRQQARLGRDPIEMADPQTSIGIEEIVVNEGFVIQTIKSIPGGPSVAVTRTMGRAQGVLNVEVENQGAYVIGKLRTRAYHRVLVGIDDTDAEEDDTSATWEISMKLLNVLEDLKGVEPLTHKLIRLNPDIPQRTAGNVACLLELAILPKRLSIMRERSVDFLKENTASNETAIALFEGLAIPPALVEFANRVRHEEVQIAETRALADQVGIEIVPVTGTRGMIGATAALAFVYADMRCLMDPSVELVVPRPPAAS